MTADRNKTVIDLLKLVADGGCSAKLGADELAAALADLPQTPSPDLLVGIETHDDAGVFRIGPELALVQTVDFFPPVCSDPYDFGQIAAANALSDVYAMGGEPLTVLNLVMFPAARLNTGILRQILTGGIDKVAEAGAVVAGGHTIDDPVPKYGLAVTGRVHPGRIITNAAARPGDLLILTKPLGTGVILAGRKVGLSKEEWYQGALSSMKQLNREGGRIMKAAGVRAATDITGFGLLGHALKLARASGVTLRLESRAVPLLPGAYELAKAGCLPGAAFRNLRFVENDTRFVPGLDYELKMLLMDAQTSGGLLICLPPSAGQPAAILQELHQAGCISGAVIGQVVPLMEKSLLIE